VTFTVLLETGIPVDKYMTNDCHSMVTGINRSEEPIGPEEHPADVTYELGPPYTIVKKLAGPAVTREATSIKFVFSVKMSAGGIIEWVDIIDKTTSEAVPIPTKLHGPQADDTQPEVAEQRNVEYVSGQQRHRTESVQQVLTAQPTSLVAMVYDRQPRDVTPRGHAPERVDWGVACEADNSFTRPTENKHPSGSSLTASTTDNAETYTECQGLSQRPLERRRSSPMGLSNSPAGRQ